MKPTMLLIACSHRLHQSHDANLWGMRLARWYMEQVPEAVILTSNVTPADDRVSRIAEETKHRFVMFLVDGEFREYDALGKAVSRKRWPGRSVDRAMVAALAKAETAGWDASALMLDHDRSQPSQEGDGDLAFIEQTLVKYGLHGNCFEFDPKLPDLGIGGA